MVMEAQKQKYFVTVDDLGQFDLDDDRSIAPAVEYALEQAGIEAMVDQNEFRRDMVAVMTTATADEVQKALQHDEIDAEVSMMEDNEEMVHTGPGHFKQDDFTTSVKKSKKFKYVPARHGDNGLADEDTQTKESIEEHEQRYQELMKEYKEFVESEEDQKKKTDEKLSERTPNTQGQSSSTGRRQLRRVVEPNTVIRELIKNKNHKFDLDDTARKIGITTQQLVTDPMFKQAIRNVLTIGIGKSNRGQLATPSGDIDQVKKDIKQVVTPGLLSKTTAVIKQMRNQPADSQKTIDDTVRRLEKLPTTTPFADLDQYVNTIDDVAKLEAIGEFMIHTLNRIGFKGKFDRFKQDITSKPVKAFGDLERTVTGQ
jgi:hypothetical protein